MPLPEDFNEWEHFQHTLQRAHNQAVREFYRDQPDNSIGTNRASAKHACIMKDDDTTTLTVLRMWLFWVVCRKMRDNFEPYYGIPVTTFERETTYKPQITLFFQEDWEDVDREAGYRRVEGRLTVRLREETPQTLTKAKLETIANKINNLFGQNDGFMWRKGKELYSYADRPNGHYFQVLARNQNDATEIIQKLLSIANTTYKQKLVRLNESIDPSTAFPTIPGHQQILGKNYRKPRKRPIAEVRFLYASIKIWGLPKPIILVDKTGYWSEAIINAWD